MKSGGVGLNDGWVEGREMRAITKFIVFRDCDRDCSSLWPLVHRRHLVKRFANSGRP